MSPSRHAHTHALTQYTLIRALRFHDRLTRLFYLGSERSSQNALKSLGGSSSKIGASDGSKARKSQGSRHFKDMMSRAEKGRQRWDSQMLTVEEGVVDASGQGGSNGVDGVDEQSLPASLRSAKMSFWEFAQGESDTTSADHAQYSSGGGAPAQEVQGLRERWLSAGAGGNADTAAEAKEETPLAGAPDDGKDEACQCGGSGGVDGAGEAANVKGHGGVKQEAYGVVAALQGLSSLLQNGFVTQVRWAGCVLEGGG